MNMNLEGKVYAPYRLKPDRALAAKMHAAVARAIASGEEDAAALASDRLIDYIERFTRDARHKATKIQGRGK